MLFNFRSDRMVEISKAFEYEEFKAFDRKRFPKVRLPSALNTLSVSERTICSHVLSKRLCAVNVHVS